MVKKTVFLLLCILLPLKAIAESSVNLSIYPDEATLEDDIELTLTISGSGSVDDPILPSIPNFKIIPQGTSSSIQIINGNMSSKKSFTYVLIPQEKGSFTIPPIKVPVDGTIISSNSVQIKITDNPNVNKGPLQKPGIPSDPFFSQDEQNKEPNLPRRTNDMPYWIEANISKANPYINEQIIYTFRFYTSVNVGQATLTLPDFKDFSVEELIPEKKGYQNINGERYVVSEKTLALFPLKPGRIVIPGSTLRVEVPDESNSAFNDPFFFGIGRLKYKAKNLKSKNLELIVRNLPLDGQPSDFTGLVGKFSATFQASPEKLNVGESVTYQVTIEGSGNIKDAVLPALISNDVYKVYDDTPAVDIVRKESGVFGTKTFKKAIVPLKTGTLNLGDMSISYFDPALEKYQQITLPPKTIQVDGNITNENLNQAGGNSSNLPIKTQENEQHTKLLAPLNANMPLDESEMLDNQIPLYHWFWPPSLYFLFYLFKKKPYALVTNRKLRALYHFKTAMRHTPATNPKEIQKALKDYFDSHFDVQGCALTPMDMVQILKDKGLPVDLVLRFEQIVNIIESQIFGTPSKGQSVNKQEIIDLMHTIDKRLSSRSKGTTKIVAGFLLLTSLFFCHSMVFAYSDSQTVKALKEADQGNYQQAEQFLLVAPDSVEKWYNLGTIYAHQKSWGLARYYLEKAQQFNPRDSHIRQNLAYVLDQLDLHQNFNFLSYFSLFEVKAFAVLSWSVFFLLRLVSFMKVEWRLNIASKITALILLCTLLAWYAKVEVEWVGQSAIITAKEAPLFGTFIDTNKELGKLTAGSKVRVLNEQLIENNKYRLQIETQQNKIGWIDKESALNL